MVVVAVNTNQGRAVDLRVENLRGLEVGGHEDVGLETESRSLRGDRVREVASRRAADGVKAKDLCIRQRDRNHPVFKAQRGHANGVVLDVKVRRPDTAGQIWRLDQRRPAGRRGRHVGIRNGKQGLVAPHADWACSDRRACYLPLRQIKIDEDFEWGKTLVTDRERLVLKPLAALATSQLVRCCHPSPSFLRVADGTGAGRMCTAYCLVQQQRNQQDGSSLRWAHPESHVPLIPLARRSGES